MSTTRCEKNHGTDRSFVSQWVRQIRHILHRVPDSKGLSNFLSQSQIANDCWIYFEQAHYYLQHFKMDEELLPAYLPETDFFARVHVFTNSSASKADIWDITLIGRIDSSKGLDNLKLFTQGWHRFTYLCMNSISVDNELNLDVNKLWIMT